MSNRTNPAQAGHDDEAGHDGVFALLPWYANRSLPSDQRGRVSRHVNGCGECRAELRFLTALNESVQGDADARHSEHADVQGSLDGVMARIDAQPAQPDRRPAGAGRSMRFRQGLEALFPFPAAGHGARWGGAALAGLAGVLVALVAVPLYVGRSADDYTVLSFPDAERSSMRLSVQLAPAASAEPAGSIIRDELQRLGAASTIERDAEGGYTVTLQDAVAVEALNGFMLALEDQALIERVRVLP